MGRQVTSQLGRFGKIIQIIFAHISIACINSLAPGKFERNLDM